MKQRKLLGLKVLDEAVMMAQDRRVPIATITRVLNLDMHYRVAYNLIKADMEGLTNLTRPDWLEAEPAIQVTPKEWELIGGLTEDGYWKHYGGE
jgi:hypothetical protein